MNYVLVDEQNNAGKQLTFEQGDSKTIYVYLQTPNNAPVQIPYNASDVEFRIQGISGTIVKNFTNGVAWLGAYFGVYIVFSSADTSNIPANRQGVSMSCKVTTPSGVQQYEFLNCFILTAPLVP